jgi:hypothetical protein
MMKRLQTLVLTAAWAAALPLAASPLQEPDRARLGGEILSRWSAGLDDGGAELRAVLATLPPAALEAAAGAKTPEELNAVVFRRPRPLALGAEDSDLVYFPIPPCRLVDTRLVPAGPAPIAAGSARSFDANNDLAAQGGAAAGCGVPQEDPAALAVTITAVNPEGAGNLRAYATSSPLPTASVLGYGLPGSGLNLANTTVVPLLQNTFNPYEFNIRADVSTVHVVVDVVGYFFSPLRAPLACQTVSLVATIPANGSVAFATPACPAGSILTGGGYDTGVAGSPQIWVYRSRPEFDASRWVCSARSTLLTTSPGFTCYARCCSTPGR